jgi:hypothetical protein
VHRQRRRTCAQQQTEVGRKNGGEAAPTGGAQVPGAAAVRGPRRRRPPQQHRQVSFRRHPSLALPADQNLILRALAGSSCGYFDPFLVLDEFSGEHAAFCLLWFLSVPSPIPINPANLLLCRTNSRSFLSGWVPRPPAPRIRDRHLHARGKQAPCMHDSPLVPSAQDTTKTWQYPGQSISALNLRTSSHR